MQEGIDLCKTNIANFLKDARLIIAENRLSHAYISVQFAIEELGKLLLFRDHLEKSTNDPVKLSKGIFRYHPKKEKRAWEFLDPKFSLIFDEGVWKEGMWIKGMWQENTTATYQTRLDCAFVDFYAMRWQLGREIKPELLIALINHIEEKLPHA